MDKEKIIKGIECCNKGIVDGKIPCSECPYNECNIVGGTSKRQTTKSCDRWLMIDALALIKEQAEEIDRKTSCLTLTVKLDEEQIKELEKKFLQNAMLCVGSERAETDNVCICKTCLHSGLCATEKMYDKDSILGCNDYKDKGKWVEQKQGEWIIKASEVDADITCNQCGCTYTEGDPHDIELLDYCPKCGAKMKGQNNE